MFKKLLVPFLVLIAIPLSAADKRTLVTLTGSTVADVICSERNGHIGFNMPLAPHFTKRGIFESFPKGMTEYPALYKTQTGTLTTAAMISFIQQSPTLFTQGDTLFSPGPQKKAYQKALQECISAHKAWYANQTDEMLAALHTAEDAVFEQLKTLSLDTKETREKLEKMLSTYDRLDFSTQGNEDLGVNKLILPYRTWVSGEKTENPVIKKGHPLVNTGKQIGVPASGVLTTVALSLCIDYLIKREVIARGKNISKLHEKLIYVVLLAPLAIGFGATICGSAASFTDFKLAPEPGNGIKVVINYVSPEAA
jgi:hypothetical protein